MKRSYSPSSCSSWVTRSPAGRLMMQARASESAESFPDESNWMLGMMSWPMWFMVLLFASSGVRPCTGHFLGGPRGARIVVRLRGIGIGAHVYARSRNWGDFDQAKLLNDRAGLTDNFFWMSRNFRFSAFKFQPIRNPVPEPVRPTRLR